MRALTGGRRASRGLPPRRGRGVERARGEAGVASGWFVQLLVVLAILGLIVYEGVALAVASVDVEGAAREVAQEARAEYRAQGSLDRARAVAEEAADTRGAELVVLETDEDALTVTLEKRANTLVVHRIGPLAERLTPTATDDAPLRP